MNSTLTPFHLAIPVDDLETNRRFYGEVLGCEEGRSSDHWVDLNFFGHQLVLHYKAKSAEEAHHNRVDGHAVPVPHFGVVLPWDVWQKLADKLKTAEIQFIIEPYLRFE